MNTVHLIGRLGAAPEMRFTPGGKAVASFRIAVDAGKDREAEWVHCEAWERTAEVAAEYTDKGKQVAVEGRLRTRSWDCDKCQHKHYRTEVVVTRLHLLGSKSEAPVDRAARQAAAATGGEVLDNDDIPF